MLLLVAATPDQDKRECQRWSPKVLVTHSLPASSAAVFELNTDCPLKPEKAHVSRRSWFVGPVACLRCWSIAPAWGDQFSRTSGIKDAEGAVWTVPRAGFAAPNIRFIPASPA